MKWVRYFILSAGVILLIAALSRLLIVFGNAQVLSLADPVLGIPLRYAVMLVAGLELAVALVCLFGKRLGFQVGWLSWLAVIFLVFQVCTFAMHRHWQTTCIGSLTDPLQLTRGLMGVIIGFIPIFLVLGTGSASVWLWLGKQAEARQREEAKSLKMSCPACGVHIRFESAHVGQQIDCPKCRAAVVLRRTGEMLKMACYFCHERIEFPPHALGDKLKCPHCSMDITLKDPAAA